MRALVDRFMKSGDYDLPINGNGFHAGVYYCRIKALGQTETRKLVLLR